MLTFEDGTTAEADVLIGCDGIGSAVRRQMLAGLAEACRRSGDEWMATNLLEVVNPVWSGSYAYRGVFPSAKLAKMNSNHRALSRPVNVSY